MRLYRKEDASIKKAGNEIWGGSEDAQEHSARMGKVEQHPHRAAQRQDQRIPVEATLCSQDYNPKCHILQEQAPRYLFSMSLHDHGKDDGGDMMHRCMDTCAHSGAT